MILPADLYAPTNNNNKKKKKATKLEIYDVMVHLVKASEPIPLGVTKLVISDTNIEDLETSSAEFNNGRARSNAVSFHVHLCVKTLFRKVLHDNERSLSNKSKKQQSNMSTIQQQQQETVLSFARSNGYTYGIDGDATLRVRLDIVESSSSSSSSLIGTKSTNTSSSSMVVEQRSISEHMNMADNRSSSPSPRTVVHSSKICNSNSSVECDQVSLAHSAISRNDYDPQDVSRKASRSSSRTKTVEGSASRGSAEQTAAVTDDDESSHGNIDPRELLQGASAGGVSAARSSSSKISDKHSISNSGSRLSAAEAHGKQLKRLQRLSKKHHMTKKATREEALWELQLMELTPTFEDDLEKEKEKKKKGPLLMSFVNMFLDFTPCAAQCQVPTSHLEQSRGSNGKKISKSLN